MKVLLELDIKDSKYDFVMELLNSIPFIKAKQVKEKKPSVRENVIQAVEEMKLIKAGKLEARPARELLDEL